MKRLIPIILLALIFGFSYAVTAAVVEGDPINFAWDANDETDLAGYRIYASNTSGVFVYGEESSNLIHEELCNGGDNSLECTRYSTDQMAIGTWYFVITAFDLAGNESDPAPELIETVVTYNPPPATPSNWRFDVTP